MFGPTGRQLMRLEGEGVCEYFLSIMQKFMCTSLGRGPTALISISKGSMT